MKKIKNVILLVLVSLIFPTLVYADCGLITYKDYKAIVSNINGANTYEGKYNDEIKKWEYKKKDVVIPYATEILINEDALKIDDDYFLNISYNGEDYSVKASDLQNKDEFKNGNIELEKSEYYVYKDTEVRSGPGVLYDIVGTIKADTNISIMKDFDKFAGAGGSIEEGAWIYISDGTISGYIYYDTCAGAIPISIGKKVKTNNFYYLGVDDKEVGLNFGDKLNVKYIISYAHSAEYYIEYNGNYILLSEEYIGEEYNHNLMLLTLKGEYLTIRDLKNSDKELRKEDYLKVGNNYKIIYKASDDYFEYYYIKIDEKIYIIDIPAYEDVEGLDYSVVIFDKEENIKFKEDMYYGFDTYKSYNIMKKGESITGYKLLNTYQEVYYNSELGFFYKVSGSNITIENNNVNSDDQELEEDTIVVDGISAKNYVVICLCGTIALSIITIIVIVLINKKKRSNKDINTNININN